jgi:hypothetical protein
LNLRPSCSFRRVSEDEKQSTAFAGYTRTWTFIKSVSICENEDRIFSEFQQTPFKYVAATDTEADAHLELNSPNVQRLEQVRAGKRNVTFTFSIRFP